MVIMDMPMMDFLRVNKTSVDSPKHHRFYYVHCIILLIKVHSMVVEGCTIHDNATNKMIQKH